MEHPIFELAPDHFPPLLKEIPDPPKKLYVRGALPDWNSLKFLTVVGSRKFTNYGREACEKLIWGLRGYPVAIVSGLALGMDAIAHQTALEAGLTTLAFPGSGLDPKVLYPATNSRLAQDILESGGALLSEFEPNFKATPYSFPRRNRLMAGMSNAVLIVEAEIKSGTLITSKFATEYNRDVFTIPGSIFSKNSEGPHMLLRLGATPITKEADLLEALGFSDENKEQSLELKYKDCSSDELKVIEILREPLSREDLLATLAMPIHKANTLLSVMEIKEMIKETMGEMRLM
ncbi:MAG: DNA-processing protein DprA [Candidatus Taylorbacteria bacterium]